MQKPLLATIVVVACWLGLSTSVLAQQVSDPLADLIVVGAPFTAPASPTLVPGSTMVAAAAVDRAEPATLESTSSSESAPGGGGPDTTPQLGPIDLPNPFDLLGGLDPRQWAGEILDAVVTSLGRSLIEAIRGFTDWATGIGDSSLNFVTRTPPAGSYESTTVRTLWDFSRAIANGGLALIVMWGGFNIVAKDHTRTPYDGVMEMLPRVILAALALNLTLELSRVLIDLNNALAGAVGEIGLPGYDQAGVEQAGMALVFVAVAYGVVVLLLVFQMLMRLALIDVLIVLAPVMVLMWVLPQTQSWSRWWSHLFPITVFQQAVQVLVLRLGTALMVELTPGSASNALLTLLLGIAVCWLTLKMPALLNGQARHAGLGSVVSLVLLSRFGGAVAQRGAGAAGMAAR
ncbi:MAG: hypothetical protein C4558_08955 [Dehalococcoidia bacterium]|nr:MAG: hypothetical protein C4558_08955 [Dehalococcoidia bacterium]